jgi:ubiquinone/menaquinone biosynthesis C-methylase UbiE
VYVSEYKRNFDLEKSYWWFIGVRLMANNLIALCNPGGRPLKILDIGCGTGALMDELTSQDHEVFGLDIAEEALRFCQMRGHSKVYLADAAKLPFADRSFDLVTAIGVIEHLDHDEIFLKEVARVLKPEACFVMLTSSFPWLWSMHDVANEHRRRYYLSDIEKKLTAAHFQTVRLSHLNFFALPLLAGTLLLHRLIYGLRPERSHRILPVPPKPVNAFLTQVLALEATLMKRVRLPWGVSMIGAFRKRSSATPRCGAVS